MKRLLILLVVVLAAISQAAIPFTGPGLNTHGQFLPIAQLKAIGVKWVRCDVPVAEASEDRIRAVVRYYRSAGLPQLWILPQTTVDAPAMARNFVHWGCVDIECGNEVDGPWFNPDGKPWSPAAYAKWEIPIWKAVHRYARVYAPVTSTWLPSFVGDAFAAGMKCDAIDFHGYKVPDMAAVCDTIQKKWRLPAIVSEVGVLDGSDPAIWFASWKMQMGVRPWCWYTGCRAPLGNGLYEERGLFDHTSGYTWSGQTSLYKRVLAAVTPSN